jgi:prolipoprotein diacylglyceryltransferase
MNGILWYFLASVFFGRLFYVFSKWAEMRNLSNFFDFFIMADYNFSLFGAIFGFLCILILNTGIFKKNIHKYMD